MQMFSIISGLDSGSKPHIRSETIQIFIYLINIENFVLMERVIMPRWVYCCKPLNWTFLYYENVFVKFSVLIRVLDLISFPRLSRDSFI